MLKVYGPARSRAGRVLWMLEECAVPYTHEDLTRYPTMEEKAAAVKSASPLGKVPFLEDGDLQLAESMAINLHLARKHGGHLWPADEGDQAKALQWSFFAIAEIEPPIIQLLIERGFRKEDQRDKQNEQKNDTLLKRPLAYLEACLAGREFLVGNSFTVADLNAASIFMMAAGAKVDLAGYPHTKAWTERCFARPAFVRAMTPRT